MLFDRVNDINLRMHLIFAECPFKIFRFLNVGLSTSQKLILDFLTRLFFYKMSNSKSVHYQQGFGIALSEISFNRLRFLNSEVWILNSKRES